MYFTTVGCVCFLRPVQSLKIINSICSWSLHRENKKQYLLIVATLSSVCLQCRRTGFNSWVGKIPLEKEMAIHSSTLAWKIPWTEEPDRLQSMGLQRVGHDRPTSLHFTLSFNRKQLHIGGCCLALSWYGDNSSFLAFYITSPPGHPYIVTMEWIAQCFLVLQPWDVVLPSVSSLTHGSFLAVKGGLI